jgi:hypothetical protein
MPTYPGSPQLTVDALLRRPTLIARSLTALTSKRFVADQFFAHGTPDQVAGGAAWYERSENIYPDRGAEEVGVRSEFPRSGWTEAILTALVHKYGLETPISFEAIRRNQLDQVARAERKLANAVTKFVDTTAMNLLLTDPAVLSYGGSTWNTASTTIIADIANARKLVTDQDEGYAIDTLIVNPAQELGLLTNNALLAVLPRETTPASLARGRVVPILGLENILVTPQLTAGTAILGMSKVAGTIADEQPEADEGYVTYDVNNFGNDAAAPSQGGPGVGVTMQGLPANQNYPADFPTVYVKVYEVSGRDEKIVRAARFPAMWLSEPKSVVKVTGV